MDIKIQNLKKIYNGNTVLDIDNLGVAKGELIGLVGNNGAGKTTLLRLILDLIQADDLEGIYRQLHRRQIPHRFPHP